MEAEAILAKGRWAVQHKTVGPLGRRLVLRACPAWGRPSRVDALSQTGGGRAGPTGPGSGHRGRFHHSTWGIDSAPAAQRALDRHRPFYRSGCRGGPGALPNRSGEETHIHAQGHQGPLSSRGEWESPQRWGLFPESQVQQIEE